jgi:hypothetical protein
MSSTKRPIVSPVRAAVNRLRWQWQRQLGWPGALSLLLLLAAAVGALAVRPNLQERQRELLRAHVARLDASTKVADAASAATAQRDPRDVARDVLPPLAQRGQSVARLLKLLEDAKLTAQRGEYSVEDEAPSLVRLRVSLPVSGTYGPLRELVATLLNDMPHLALDSMDLERAPEGGGQVTGHLRLSLYFRKEST